MSIFGFGAIGEAQRKVAFDRVAGDAATATARANRLEAIALDWKDRAETAEDHVEALKKKIAQLEQLVHERRSQNAYDRCLANGYISVARAMGVKRVQAKLDPGEIIPEILANPELKEAFIWGVRNWKFPCCPLEQDNPEAYFAFVRKAGEMMLKEWGFLNEEQK